MLRQGTLNRRMSKFGGKPSPVYVFEAQLQAPAAAQDAAAAEAPVAQQGAAVEAQAQPSGAAAAQEERAGSAAVEGAAAGASQSERRHLRVIFAAREDATVVLTAVDLEASD